MSSNHPDYEEIDRLVDSEGEVLAVVSRRLSQPQVRFKLCRTLGIYLREDQLEGPPPPTTVYLGKRHIPAASRLIGQMGERLEYHLDRLQIELERRG